MHADTHVHRVQAHMQVKNTYTDTHACMQQTRTGACVHLTGGHGHMYSQTHEDMDTHKYTQIRGRATDTCRHTQSQLRGGTQHPRTRTQTRRNTHACMYTPDIHLPQVHKHMLRHGARTHTDLCRPTSTWTHACGRRPTPACTLPCGSQAPLPCGPHPPIHLSVDGGQQTGLKPGSGGWASGGPG